jgi:hypothetical protein
VVAVVVLVDLLELYKLVVQAHLLKALMEATHKLVFLFLAVAVEELVALVGFLDQIFLVQVVPVYLLQLQELRSPMLEEEVAEQVVLEQHQVLSLVAVVEVEHQVKLELLAQLTLAAVAAVKVEKHLLEVAVVVQVL